MSRITSTGRKKGAKREEILAVATRYFLEHGFAGASVNEMSRQSGISKETIYRYFRNKQDLFAVVLDNELSNYVEGLGRMNEFRSDMPIRDALIHAGTILLDVLLAEKTMALRRIIIHESYLNAEIGRMYYQRGPGRAFEALELLFRQLRERGERFRFESTVLSDDFLALLIHTRMLQQQYAMRKTHSDKENVKYVRRMVDNFLAAYHLA